MLKLAFSIIVKDDSELEQFKNSVYSVLPYVSFAQITSNGKKTDKIKEFVDGLSDIFPNVEIDYTHLEWKDDFSEQRNHSFNRIPKDYDYIYWQDSDDILVGGDRLIDIATISKNNKKDIVFFAYWYGCDFNGEPSLSNLKEVLIEHYRERLIRPGTVEWKGRLHETPVEVTGQKNVYTKFTYDPKDNPVAVMHTVTSDESLEKMNRNRRILEIQLEEERNGKGADPRTLLYLMKIYAESDSETLFEKCLEMGEEYLSKSGWDEERANCNDLMAVCSSKLGKANKAIEYEQRAIGEYPHNPIYYVRLAMFYLNVDRDREAEHWLKIAGDMDMDKKTAGINNIKELKVLFTQTLLKLNYKYKKDIDKSVETAKLLYKEQPIPENKENLLFLMDRQDLKDSSENTLKLIKYLENIGRNKSIIPILDNLPKEIAEQPFAVAYRRKNIKPRTWCKNEICYFANFGGKHFEKWDGNSTKDGIGGSETAVINLSEQWTKLGYKVTVYGDPKDGPTEINGVKYLPWYYFNKGDKFNIFIQWRMANLEKNIKAEKFLVDLHDICNQIDYPKEKLDAIDGIMVKSKAHRDMLPDVPDDKIFIISNGINL